jgi:hypothetical protein
LIACGRVDRDVVVAEPAGAVRQMTVPHHFQFAIDEARLVGQALALGPAVAIADSAGGRWDRPRATRAAVRQYRRAASSETRACRSVLRPMPPL